ncbi:MAG: magnesium/cobalt transporter CorA [Fimbriimonas sp.]
MEAANTGYTLTGVSLISGVACSQVNDDEIVDFAASDRPIWLHVQVDDVAAATHLLRDRLHFHELAVEDALSPNERPSTHELDDALFLVVPALAPEVEGGYIEISFFLRANSLVSVSLGPCPAIQTWSVWFGKKDGHHATPASHVLHTLIDAIVDAYFPALDALEDEVDDITDRIFNGDTTHVANILRLKRRTIEFRRHLGPLREVLNSLLRRDQELISADIRPYFADIYEHSLRLIEMIEIHRDALSSLLDIHLSTVSNNLNQVVKQMTVVSTVLMASALIAGIYGMNFKMMPETEWVYGYPMSIGLMVVVALAIIAVFKRIKWI